MKKIITIIILIAIMTTLFIGCDPNNKDRSNNETEGMEKSVLISTEKSVMLSPASIRKVESVPNEPVLKSSFKDDEYYYYLFYLGDLKNVPLDSSFSFLHEYKSMGLNTELEMTSTVLSVSEISSMASQTVTETVKLSSSLSSKISAKAGTKNNYVSAEIAMSFSSSASISNQFTNSYQRASKFSEEQQKKVRISFNENTADGYYGYAPTAILKMYSLVVYDPAEDKFSVDTYSEIDKNWIGFYYYSSFEEFANYQYETLDFSIPSNLPTPTNEYQDETSWSVITSTMNRYNCNDGNGYNKAEQEELEGWRSRHDGFEIGALSLYGCTQNGNHFRVNDVNDLSIKWKVLRDVTSLPLVGNASLTKLNSDTCKTIHGTDFSNKNSEIKYGASWVRVTYSDDTQKTFSKPNIMENANTGTIVEIFSSQSEDFNKNKDISKIEVIIAYELYCGGPGFLGIWWHEYTNWRLEYTYDFTK